MSHVLANFVTMLAAILSLLVLVRVVLSWTNADGGGGFTAFVYQATEPLLGPIRRVLPPMGGREGLGPHSRATNVRRGRWRRVRRVGILGSPRGRLAQLVRVHGSHP